MVKKCVVIDKPEDTKIMAIVVRRMANEGKTVSYSEVLRDLIKEGLKHIQ